MKIELADSEFQLVINALATRPWAETNDLIVKLMNQRNAPVETPPAPAAKK
jgi:hypothetical protein